MTLDETIERLETAIDWQMRNMDSLSVKDQILLCLAQEIKALKEQKK